MTTASSWACSSTGRRRTTRRFTSTTTKPRKNRSSVPSRGSRASTPSSTAPRPPRTRSRAALPPLDCVRPRLPDHRGARNPMRKLLLQLDSSRLPSAFDQVVAYDAGADKIMSYGGVTESDVRDLVYGCLFTRGPKDLQNTAVWIGGTNMTAGEQLLAMAVDAIFGQFRVSIMLDSNGSNTTAVAAVVKIEQALGSVTGKK